MQAAARAKQEISSLQQAADKAAAEKAKLENSKAKRLRNLKAKLAQMTISQC